MSGVVTSAAPSRSAEHATATAGDHEGESPLRPGVCDLDVSNVLMGGRTASARAERHGRTSSGLAFAGLLQPPCTIDSHLYRNGGAPLGGFPVRGVPPRYSDTDPLGGAHDDATVARRQRAEVTCGAIPGVVRDAAETCDFVQGSEELRRLRPNWRA